MDLKRDIVMGHEFCAEVVDYGPQTRRHFKPGARVCAMPVLIRPTGVETVGYSNDNPGGYGEYMRLTEKLLLEVPNGLATDSAALTEPLAVGYHAVAKARLERDEALGHRMRSRGPRGHRRAQAQGRASDRRRGFLSPTPPARGGDGRRCRDRSQ